MGMSDPGRCIMHILGLHDAHSGWWGYMVQPYRASCVDWFEGDLLRGFISMHVDHFRWSGDWTLENNTIEQLRKRFPIGE